MLFGVRDYAYAAIIAALVVGAGTQTVRLSAAKQQMAESVAQRERERAAATKELAEYRYRVAELVRQHATNQQEIVHEYEKRLRAAERTAADRSATVNRLRDQIRAFAAVGGEADQAVGCSAQPAADRLATLGTLLVEGVELVAEGASIVERRDAEVSALAKQIQADRAACMSP